MRAIFFEGPDGCGKTHISNELAMRLGIPRFKVESEKFNWKTDNFKNSLYFDLVLPQFAKQLDLNFISDRGYASEWVYAKLFGRETDWDALARLDENWGELGASHVLTLRRDYSRQQEDDIIPADRIQEIHDRYLEFAEWTKTDVVAIYVDDFKDYHAQHGDNFAWDIDAQIREIGAGLEAFNMKRNFRRVYDIIKEGGV